MFQTSLMFFYDKMIPKYKSFIIFLLIVYKVTAIQIKSDCPSSQYIPKEAIYSCYDEHNTVECDSNKIEFFIHEPNITAGTVDIEFNFNPSCPYYIKVSNYVYYKYYAVSDKKEATTGICKQNAMITLKNIQSNVYYVSFYKNCSLMTTILKNWQTKFVSSFNTVKCYIQHRLNKTFIELTHDYFKSFPLINISIECYNNNCSLNTTYYVQFNTQESLNFKNLNLFDKSNNSLPNVSISCDLNVTIGYFDCLLLNLDNGSYKMYVKLKDTIACQDPFICEIATITDKKIPEIEVQYTRMENKNSFSMWIMFGGFIIFFTSLIIIGFSIYRRRVNTFTYDNNIPFIISNVYESYETSKTVLLLYPRDHESVMDTIEALRDILKTKGFQVFDIYNPEDEKAISTNPEKWLYDIISDKSTKVLLIMTFCGQILINYPTLTNNLYQTPVWKDSLYPYAITLLREKIPSNNCSRFFIVDLGFSYLDYVVFQFLVPSTKYNLPFCFNELFRDLSNSSDNLIEFCDDDLVNFKDCYEKMLDCLTNPNYLKSILNVNIVKVDNTLKINLLTNT